jgi:hypothetical protein
VAIVVGCGTGETAADRTASRNRDAAETTSAPFVLTDGPNDCGADTLPVHSDPIELAKAFVTYDTSGKRFDDNDKWAYGAVTCVARLSSDIVGVIASYSLTPLTIGADSARVLVKYRHIFEWEYNSAGAAYHLVPRDREIADTMLLVRTQRGWRILELNASAHLSPGNALRVLTELDSVDRAKLASLSLRPDA